MTKEQAENLNLGIKISDKSLIMIETAIELIGSKTSIPIDDLESLPARARLFIVKYTELMSSIEGVSSESISNLSQSFNQDKTALLNNLLEDILGDDLVSEVQFVAAVRKWD